MRRDGDPAGVAGASVARWLLRILVATTVVLIGLALAATTAQADVKPTPLGSAGKLTQTVRSAGGGAAKAKAAVRSTAPKAKIRVKPQATPVRRAVRKAAPVRTYRVAKATRTVARKAAPVRNRISTGQRKTSLRPTVRTVRKATAPKARLAQPTKTSPNKINSSPSTITKSSVRKATTAKRRTSTEAAKVAQIPRLNAQDRVTGLTLLVDGVQVPAVVTPEIKVTVGDSVELSAPPVGLQVPLLSLPEVTLPPAELPTVTVPGTDLPTVTVPGTDLPTVALPRTDLPTASRPPSKLTAASPVPAIDERAGPVDGAAFGRTARARTAQQPLGLLGWAPTVVSAYTAVLVSLDTGMLSAIGPPAVVLLDDLGQWIRAVEVPVVGPTTALIIAAAIAAATGTASAGSAGGGGQAVVPAALRLPALAGSRRLNSRLRESAFRTPRRPGFSPD